MAQANFLNLRLFIEGREVPIIAASVNVVPNSPATASLQIIPTDTVFLFKPRTAVHLFFFDYLDEEAIGDDRYKLLFSGEVTGISFTKAEQERFAVLTCLHYTNVWETTFQYYMNIGGNNINIDGVIAQMGGVSSSLFNNVPTGGALTQTRQFFLDGATRNDLPLGAPGVKGLLGGVLNLLEKIGGIVLGGKVHGAAINPFYLGYEIRNRLMDQIFIPGDNKDNTAVKLIDLPAFQDIILRDLGQGGDRLSIRQILDIVLGYIYYSFVVIPTPKYDVQGRRSATEKALQSSLKKSRTNTPNDALKQLKIQIDKLKERASKKFVDLSINTGKVDILSDIFTDKEIIRLLESGSTSTSEFDNTYGKVTNEIAPDKDDSVDQLIEKALARKSTIDQGIRKINGGILDPLSEGKVTETLTSLEFNNYAVRNLVNGSRLMDDALLLLTEAKALEAQLAKKQASIQKELKALDLLDEKTAKQKLASVARLDRLNAIVFRPDMYFLPPPACNVLFPDLYGNISFNRNMLDEYTRVFLDTTYQMIDQNDTFLKALKSRFLAPNIPEVEGFAGGKGLVTEASGIQNVRILPHEAFSGILPAYITLPDLAVYYARFNRNIKGKDAANAGVQQGDIPYLRHAANFEFFKLRFGTRSLSVQGRFNPYVVPGFPALVIDKSTPTVEFNTASNTTAENSVKNTKTATVVETPDIKDPRLQRIAGNRLETVEEQAQRAIPTSSEPEAVKVLPTDPKISKGSKVGTHFIGVIMSMQHSISQDGGNTFLDLGFVRTHNEAIDFSGDLKDAALEDLIFPSWYADIYRPKNITEYYEEAFGTTSIFGNNVVQSLLALGGRDPATLTRTEIASSTEVAKATIQKALANKIDIKKLEYDIKVLRASLETRNVRVPVTGVPTFDADHANAINFLDSLYHIKNKQTVEEMEKSASSRLAKLDTALKIIKTENFGRNIQSFGTGFAAAITNSNLLILGKPEIAARFKQALDACFEALSIIGEIKGKEEQIAKKNADVPKHILDAANDSLARTGDSSNVNMKRSVEALVELYTKVVEKKKDVDVFVNNFIFRKIATLPQVMGTPIGTDGFFSKAFGTAEIPEISSIVKTLSDAEKDIASRFFDPREDRGRIVGKYIEELQFGAARG
jgi:hypothetical protein